MRKATIFVLISTVMCGPASTVLARPDSPETQANPATKQSAAAENTRAKLLKVRVTVTFKDVRLGDILKELAARVEMETEQPLMWTYGAGFPFDRRVTVEIKDQPLDQTLDKLFTQVGRGTGYVILSKEGGKHDGWIRLTSTGERGDERPPPTPAEEARAAENLELAKKLIASGRPASAEPLLKILVRDYVATKAGKEAILLLEKMDQ